MGRKVLLPLFLFIDGFRARIMSIKMPNLLPEYKAIVVKSLSISYFYSLFEFPTKKNIYKKG